MKMLSIFGVALLVYVSCTAIQYAAGNQYIRNFKYTRTENISTTGSNAAAILKAPGRYCALQCLTRDCLYIAEKMGSKECASVGQGETLPKGMWKISKCSAIGYNVCICSI